MKETVLVAKTFILNPEGKILTLRRSRTDSIRPSTWDLPGGSVEFGEDPRAAAIRETEEEAGLNLKNPQVFIIKTTSKDKYVVRLLFYAYTDEDKVTLSHEHDQFKWVTMNEFSKLDIPNYYKDSLNYLPT